MEEPRNDPRPNYAIRTTASVVFIIFGIALARYRWWARWLILVLLIESGTRCVSDGAVPILLLIFAFIGVIALFGRRGREVFGPAYADLLASEPELRPVYRNPLTMWMIGVSLLSTLIGGLEIPLP